MGVEPTTLCLASIEGGKTGDEGKPQFLLIPSRYSSVFFNRPCRKTIPKSPVKVPHRPLKSETVSLFKVGGGSSIPSCA